MLDPLPFFPSDVRQRGAPGTSDSRRRMRRALAVASAASRLPSLCMMASAPFAAVARYGGSAAEKQYPAPLRTQKRDYVHIPVYFLLPPPPQHAPRSALRKTG